MDNRVAVEMTRGERVHLWDALDRVIAGQPVPPEHLASLRWIRDRISRQCHAEVGDMDLSGDRAEAFRRITTGSR